LNKDFEKIGKRKIRYNIKKAEETLLVSRNFREIHFEVEKKVKKLI
jgi:ribosomal protein S6